MNVKIGLADDHQLFLKSLTLMLESFNEYDVIIEAANGKDLQKKILSSTSLPEIIFIDVHMPLMDGIETANWLTENYPAIKLVALSQSDSDTAIVGMLKAGCCAYLLKDTHPNELEIALKEIQKKGSYNSDKSNINFRKLLLHESEKVIINDVEKLLLLYASTDLTYREISLKMKTPLRSIDTIRENLFKKLSVESRVGLVMEAMKRELISLEELKKFTY